MVSGARDSARSLLRLDPSSETKEKRRGAGLKIEIEAEGEIA